MSEQDVFSGTPENKQESTLDSLVGDGKKFSTAEELAKGKQEADSFIEQLQGELKGVRDDLTLLEGKSADSKTVADLIKAVQGTQKQEEGGSNQLSDDDLRKQITEIMQGVSDSKTRGQNRETGNALVLEKMGGDVEAAKLFIAERAKQLGMSTAALAELSERSPDAFAKLVDVDPSTIIKSIVSLDGMNSETLDKAEPKTVIDGHKTKAYYNKLKQEMGIGKYWSDSKVQGEYYQDALALGDRFNQ